MELIKNLKEISLVKNLLLVILGTMLLAISAKVKIPFWPVPMTMQTFVVLLLGVLYGWKLGLLTISLYLFEGIVGLPVFAGTPEKGLGLVYFTGPTMGYLIGFLVAVYLAGFFKFDNKFFKNFLKLAFSVSFIYFFGLVWLGSLIGWDKPIFELGAKPFLLAELFKVLLLSILIPKILKFRS
tara:strand:+ start:3763 stop:4308 length:546 start_codon:yes stop_codon:yes gene_type:complete